MHKLLDPVAPLVSALEGEGGYGDASCYLVGGAVRDYLLGVPSKDLDIEVHGMQVETVVGYLKDCGARIDEVGKAFGVLKVTYGGETLDFSFPRTEQKTSAGHTGFEVSVDPYLGIEKALARRDFTINAIAMASDGSLIDPFGGIQDLITKQLIHVGPAFSEDPLRILRGIQFAARFDMEISPQTAWICRKLSPELDSISIERVWGEFEKIGTKGVSIMSAHRALFDCGFMTNDQRFGPIGMVFNNDPDLSGLEGNHRVAVALAALNVDPIKVGAPKNVTRMINELQKVLPLFQSHNNVPVQAFAAAARQMKETTLRDAHRISHRWPDKVDVGLMDGPRPLFLNGNDALEAGFQGADIGKALKDAARTQDGLIDWAFNTRIDALEWLKREAARRLDA